MPRVLPLPEDAESLDIVWPLFLWSWKGFGELALPNVLRVGSFGGGFAVSIGEQVGKIGG